MHHSHAGGLPSSPAARLILAVLVAAGILLGSGLPAAAEQAGRDAAFSGDGVVTLDFDGSTDLPRAVGIQSDGKIVVAGSALIENDYDIAIARWNADGSPDATFGVGGLTVLDSGQSDVAYAMAIQADGAILIGGATGGLELVVRLLGDGELDPSFGDGGILIPLARDDLGTVRPAEGTVHGIVVEAGGQIVTAVTAGAGPVRQVDVAIARYTTLGEPDETFGTSGRTTVDTGSTPERGFADDATALARMSDGGFVVVGRRSAGPSESLDTLVVRFTPWGALDTGFNGTGYRVMDFGVDEGAALLVDSVGRVVVGSRVYNGTGALARLMPSGALDPTFGTGGIVRGGPRIETIARDGAGRILVGGFGAAYELARFSATGAPDGSFNGGIYRSNFGPDNEFPTAMVVQPDGRIVVVGYTYASLTGPYYDTDWTVERIALSPDPPAPPTTTVPTRQPPTAPARPLSGYWMLTSVGQIYAFGAAGYHGAPGIIPAASMAATPIGGGYWIATSTGAVWSYGGAPYLGGSPSLRSGETVTSISAVPDGRGYWLFSSLGRVFPYGSARHLGDLGTTTLNGPVLGSVATPTGDGYYMVASDGGVFAFGDAAFLGSMGGQRLNGRVVGLAPDPDRKGYWLVAADGGLFAFDAAFRGSMGGRPLNRPVVGLVAFGDGYLMVASDGGIFSFSTSPFAGSLGNQPPPSPVVAVAAFNG